MRFTHIALMVLSIQMGMGLIHLTGLFGDSYYEADILDVEVPESPDALSEIEQLQAAVKYFNMLVDSLTWGWIKTLFMPWYNQDATLQAFIDKFVDFLNLLSIILVGLGVIEFVRNQTNVLG